MRQLFAGALVGYLSARFIAPRLAEAAARKPDGIATRYGAAPWLLAGGYAAQRLGSGIVRTIGDTAMVSGALMLGTRFGRAKSSTADTMLLGAGPAAAATTDGDVEGDDGFTRDEKRALAAFNAVQGELMSIEGDDIEGDDIEGDDIEGDDIEGDDIDGDDIDIAA